MSGSSNQITYQDQHELGFFERLLLGRVEGVVKAVLVVATIISVGLAIFHLYVAAFGTPEGRSFRSVHLTGMLTLAFLMHPLFRGSIREPLIVAGSPQNMLRLVGFCVDLALIALILFIEVYTIHDIDAFHLRFGDKDPTDLLVGGLLIALVLEATRRAVGWAMVIITGFFIFHALYAHYFFGFFYGPPVRFAKFIDVLFMSSDGIFGIPLHVCATYIVLFIIFGAVLIRSGAGRFFIDLAVALTGHRVGGPAKASAVASGFMGTVSGSAVANVVTTGSFTIPLMKNLGYRPKFAAAVEACASSGGQITPPIMGAAAFIMAEFLETPYSNIIVAAAIPAFLYFVTVYFMVHLEAEKHGIGRIEKERLPNINKVLKRGWHLLIALAVLVYFLMIGYTPMKSAIWGLASLFVLSFINKDTRMSPVDLMAALESGIRATVPVTIACACAGLIIGSVFVSGLGLKFTQSVIEFSGGSLLVLLALTGHIGHHPRHGHNHDRRLHHGRGPDRAGTHQDRRRTDRRAHVCLLFRRRLDNYATGCARILCRGGHCQDQADGDGRGVDARGDREIPGTPRLRLQPVATVRRLAMADDHIDNPRHRGAMGAVDQSRRLVPGSGQQHSKGGCADSGGHDADTACHADLRCAGLRYRRHGSDTGLRTAGAKGHERAHEAGRELIE